MNPDITLDDCGEATGSPVFPLVFDSHIPGASGKIADLSPGQWVTMHFHSSDKPYTEDVQFVELSYDGDVATWHSDDENYGDYEWRTYKSNGKWCYGGKAEPVSLLAVLTKP